MLKPFLLPALLILATATKLQAAELTVNIEGLQSNSGKVIVRVYSGKDQWLEDDGHVALAEISLADWTADSTVTTALELEAGEYAVSAYQDEDEDGELDSNFIGIPKEPAGMSNKPKARMGPPKYEDAAFDLPEEGLSIAVELN
jgi:uncharacterized protein (DUF2141 family)